jgi:hypothetical protein
MPTATFPPAEVVAEPEAAVAEELVLLLLPHAVTPTASVKTAAMQIVRRFPISPSFPGNRMLLRWLQQR